MSERNKQDDYEKLALAFFKNLRISNHEYGGWGLDDKRPFGSSQVEFDILEIVGWEPEDGDDYSAEQEEYANELYSGLRGFLESEWVCRKTHTNDR